MDIPTSSANSFKASTSSLSSEMKFTPTFNSTLPFLFNSFLSPASSAASGFPAISNALLNPVIAAMYGYNNGAKSSLNNAHQNISMGSAHSLQQHLQEELMFPTADIPQTPQTDEIPKSPAKTPEPSTSPASPATSASAFFESLGSPKLVQSSGNSPLSGQMSSDSFDFETDDQQQQPNFYLSCNREASGPSNGLFQNSFFGNSHIFSDVSTPAITSTVLDQNNSLCRRNFRDLFGQQISVKQAICLQNAALTGIVMANRKESNGKSSTEQPTDGRKNRRNRTIFSKFQLEEMEKCYQSSPYPDVTTRDRISKLIELPEEKVQVWLKNRRAKNRKFLQNLTNEGCSTISLTGSRIRRNLTKQQKTPITTWNSATNKTMASLFPPVLSTDLSSPPGFDTKNFSSMHNLQQSLFENLLGSSQLFSV
ncbi:homeobox domain-containing protein [Ditylenchus destructor]|uniref:Homeobox domain-containing protein n=1 Tax=Ditylenchus destructor TaxID=166010 RepID=A0AAD4N5N0_9BILA|nr:homeobox domain-containing protein [Ditylenchus destructor]